MYKENLLARLVKTKEKFVDDLVYGKKEDIFIRNARNSKYEGKCIDRTVAAWLPGWFAYVYIKKDLANPEYTKKQKIISCVNDISIELTLDAIRVGCCYGVYLLIDRF